MSFVNRFHVRSEQWHCSALCRRGWPSG